MTALFIAYPAAQQPDAAILAVITANGGEWVAAGHGLGERDIDAVWTSALGPAVRAGICRGTGRGWCGVFELVHSRAGAVPCSVVI